MPRYRFHLLPEDGCEDLELRFADDVSALRTAEVVLRDQLCRKRAEGKTGSTKVIEVIRSDGTRVGFAEVPQTSFDAALKILANVRASAPQNSLL
jgi:hypothetical protein